MPTDRLAELLIGGVAYQDVIDEVDSGFLSLFNDLDPAGFVIRPLPNTQFGIVNGATFSGKPNADHTLAPEDDPRRNASAEYGEKVIASSIVWIAKQVQAALAALKP